MAKKKAVKKAKAASKPAKASAKKKSAPVKKSSTAKPKTVVKAKSKAAPKKKAAAKKSAVASRKTGVAAKAKTAAKTVKASPAKKAVAKTAKEKPVKAAPAKPKVKDEGQILAESVVNGMLEKKGLNIRWLDLRSIENSVCDYFIICEGNSNTQVDAIAQSVVDIVKKETGQRPYRSEGWDNALWVLIDYVNVVVHVFERETRYFYNLESLWADAEEIKVEQ